MILLTSLYLATGLRVSELRQAHIEDLDKDQWTLYVREHKNMNSTGYKRTVTIMPPFRPAILAYLKERKERLKTLGMDSIYLIPALVNGKDEPCSSNHFRVLKKELEKRSGIKFKLKDNRATFASLTVQMNSNLLPDVSKQLGRSSLMITERYYAATKADDAGLRVAEAWDHKQKMFDKDENQKECLASNIQKNILIKP